MLKNTKMFGKLHRMLVCFGCFALCLLSTQSGWGKSSPFPMTAQEQAWLKSIQGRPVRVAPVSHHPPFSFFNENGKFVGMGADFLKLFQDQLGFEVEIVRMGGLPERVAAISDGSVDLIPGMLITSERKKIMHFTDVIISLSYAVVTQTKNNSISVESDLSGKKVALLRDQKPEKMLVKKYPEMIPVYVDTALDAMRSVASGKADATVLLDAPALYLASHYVLINLKIAATLDWGSLSGAFAVRKDWPEFNSLLNKSLAALSETQKNAIFNNWAAMKSDVSPHSPVDLSKEELAWLAEHPVIRVGADSAWAPIDFFNDGEYKGLAIDYVKEIEQILGVRFEFVRENWQELILLAKQKDLDMFSCVAPTAERDKYLIFTDPYLKMPVGIFTREDSVYFSDINMLTGKKVAVVEGHAIHDYLVANYSELDLVLLKTPEEGIDTVRKKEAFAFINNSITTGYYLSQHGALGIKMVGEVPFFNAQAMGVRKDWPQLRDILQKAIDAIPDAKKNAMYNQWVPMIYEKPLDYRKFWEVGTAVLLFICFVLVWNRRLKSVINKRTAALNKTYAQYREAQKIARLGHWELNLRNNHLKWSDEVYRIYEIAQDRFTASYDAFLDAVHPDDLEVVNRAYRDSVKNKTGYDLVHRLLMSDGRIKFVNERCRTDYDQDGTPLRSLGTVQDITEYMLAEESRLQLLTAIEQASESFIITDKNIRIQYVNPAFEQLTGYAKDEVLDKNPRIIKSGKQSDSFYREMWDTLKKGKVWKGHLINRKKDGSLFEEDATITPVVDDKGIIINYIAVKRDITQQVIIEKQLRQAMKMEAIGTLAGGIAHDFNNILAIMLGYSEIVRDNLPADSLAKVNIEQIIIAGNRAADLVTQILTFSRQGEEEFRRFKMQLIIKEALKLLRASLPATIELKQDIDDNAGIIFGDTTQIHQVLMNLCTNAKHAIGDSSGILSVSLSEVTVTNSNAIHDCPQLGNGTYVDLEISDTGCGMDGLTQSKIFDPFFTTKEQGKGTGLGLAVVHGIIKQHKGEIVVRSKPGQGTTFHVYLPVVIEVDVQAEQKVSEDIPRGSEQILFVDDEKMIVHMMQDILNNLGYKVTPFTSSIEALDTYKKNPGHFDLVITDMTMPKMTGVELAEKIFELRADQPVVLCTGFSEVIDEEMTKSLGIREYIKKPADNHTLAKAIRRALKPS